MVWASIHIILNRKSDLTVVIEVLKELAIKKPIYITELEDSYEITFDDNDSWHDIDYFIGEKFDGYEFKTNIRFGKEDIIMYIYRSESSTYAEDRETYNFLVPHKDKQSTYVPQLSVLAKNHTKNYPVRIVEGENAKGKTGYVILKDDTTEILVQKLFPNIDKAFFEAKKIIVDSIEKELKSKKKR